MSDKKLPRLENWSVGTGSIGPYMAPELITSHAYGEVYDNPNFDDGKMIRTSTLKEINVKEGWCQTLNTKYLLGKIDPEYQKWCDENNIDLSKSFNSEDQA